MNRWQAGGGLYNLVWEENGDILLFWGQKRDWPFGEDGWVRRMAKRFGMESTLRPPMEENCTRWMRTF